jgi:NAD(P)-dependent dehydrogenase (short-subunit alcohol dehydrogenase family)
MLRVSIIGVRRNRNGIGEYIAKYFHHQKASVVAVLGTSEETRCRALAFKIRIG